jgi:transcriptional regulator with XRE-family HTH domain
MEEFAALLRAARALTGMSQKGVGEWIGLEPQEVSRWENSRYKLLSASGIGLQKAFERKGIEFLAASDELGAGVRWREPGRDGPYSGAQFRAARVMTNNSMRDIECSSGLSRSFLTRLEQNQLVSLNLDKRDVLVARLSVLGVVLTGDGPNWGAGVRFLKNQG